VRAAPDQAAYVLGDACLRVATDDTSLLQELAQTFGPPQAGAVLQTPFWLSASVHADGLRDGFARVLLEAPSEELLNADDFLLALAAADFPFRLLPSPPPWTHLALPGESAPFLSLNGPECRVRLADGWRKAVALLLLHRLMRVQREAIFFHAASVALGGRGVLLVGPKGRGKSTLALELAARGHALLGDEHACYRPSDREILPFRRPVGIKPGPRGAGVERALRRLGLDPERDGMMRIDVEALFPTAGSVPAPLAAVVYLDGFAAETTLRAVPPGRTELAGLQVVGSSLVNAPGTRRVFEMAQLLSAARVYRMTAGTPDDAARHIEQERKRWA